MTTKPWYGLLPASLAGIILLTQSANAADHSAALAALQTADHQRVLEITQELLREDPNDFSGTLLRGVALARIARTQEAKELFERLHRSHPQRPEPLNNLATLSAAQGDYERARDYLLQALSTHDSYAQAQRNLSSVYAALASKAYAQVLENTRPGTAQVLELALLEQAPDIEPIEVVVTRVVEVEPKPEPAAATLPAVVVAKLPDQQALQQAARETLQDWADAWSRQDIEAYLGHYADAFLPAGGLTRPAWESQRRERVAAPRWIRVELEELSLEEAGDGLLRARFLQDYRSNTYSDRGYKVILLGQQDGRWAILAEQVES